MQYLAVLLAAAASYAFGAVWYMQLADPWMKAVGLTKESINAANKTPYIISGICSILVAGMMRHIFVMSGLDTLGDGLMGGFGLGLLIATPWIVTNVAFAGKPRSLMWIDGGYATIGCTIMGVVLSFFL
jgi:hypothetical protein